MISGFQLREESRRRHWSRRRPTLEVTLLTDQDEVSFSTNAEVRTSDTLFQEEATLSRGPKRVGLMEQ